MKVVERTTKRYIVRACLAAVVAFPCTLMAQAGTGTARVVKPTETLPPLPGAVAPAAAATAAAPTRRAPAQTTTTLAPPSAVAPTATKAGTANAPAAKPTVVRKAPDVKPTSVTVPVAPKVTPPTRTQSAPRKPVTP